MQISWLRTEYAHEVFALTDLLEQRVVSFLQARLFLKVDFRRPPVHGVDDALQLVQAFHGNPRYHFPTERGGPNVCQVRQRPSEDREIVKRWAE